MFFLSANIRNRQYSLNSSNNNEDVDYGVDATYFISSSEGDDSNNGTSINTPWASIDKLNQTILSSGDKIAFKASDEFIGEIIINYNGTSGNEIVFGAYGIGVKPKIYGSEIITGWTQHSGNIYKATYNTDITQLFVDGKRMTVARYPNTGFFYIDTVNSSTQFTSSDLSTSIDYTGASWTCRTRQWSLPTHTVTTSSSQTVTIDVAPYSGLGVDEGFFMCNKLEFLDQPGEWYYDDATNTVYLWTPNGDSPANYTVRGSTTSIGISADSKAYVTFENLEVSQYQNRSISLTNSNHMTVDNCEMRYSEDYSLYLVADSYGTYTNNYMIGSNTRGIYANTDYSYVSDNTIQDIGVIANLGINGSGTLGSSGSAITIKGDNNEIYYNHIENVAYAGVSFIGANTMIKYNFIKDVCTVIDDGAAIYTYVGSNPDVVGSSGSEIYYNLIFGFHGTTAGYPTTVKTAYGIYLDDGTRDVDVRYNTLEGGTGGLFNHIGKLNYFEYNTVKDCIVGILCDYLSGGPYYSESIWNYNTVYADDRDGLFIWWGDGPQKLIRAEPNIFGNSDNNRFIHHYATDNQFVNGGTGLNFTEWKGLTGNEASSTMDQSTLGTGEIGILFYNESKSAVAQDLSGYTWVDLDGNSVTSLTLQPYTSQILIRS